MGDWSDQSGGSFNARLRVGTWSMRTASGFREGPSIPVAKGGRIKMGESRGFARAASDPGLDLYLRSGLFGKNSPGRRKSFWSLSWDRSMIPNYRGLQSC